MDGTRAVEMTSTNQALIAMPQASDDDIRPLVKSELNRIKLHPLFKDTTRMKRFLHYVVTEALAGREDRLKGYAIGLEVFDRPDDFDPQADTIVRVQAGQLRRRLDLYYASEGKDSLVRILVPKGQYAPVFEIRRNVEQSTEKETPAEPIKIELHNRPGILVPTFQYLAPDEDIDYFAEGITAELVNALVQFRYIRIVARTVSVVDDLTETSNLSAIAEKYNVQFALTGNVRRAGNLVRVSVNLLSTETGEHIYSKIFDREYTVENLFAIQEEIASYIAAKIVAPFGIVNRYNRRHNFGRHSSMASYEAFLKYYEMNISPTASKAAVLLEEFEEIVRKTPRFSSAWAVVSFLNTFLATQHIPSVNPEEKLETAIKAGIRASAIDPENGLAFMALFQAYYHSGKIELADEMAAKSIALNPNDYNMLTHYSIMQAFIGNESRALAFQSAAMELITRPPVWFYFSSLTCLFQKGEFENVLKTIGEFDADSPLGIQFLGLASMGHLGLIDEAKSFIDSVINRNADYAQHALNIFSLWQPNPELLELAISGWRKAGFDI